MAQSKIEWTEETWNFIAGCEKRSAGCTNCYAERMTNRLRNTEKYKDVTTNGKFNGMVRFLEKYLDEPRQKKKETVFFVCSMADLFHRQVTNIQILKAYDVMHECQQHTFLVLTKRIERVLDWYFFFLMYPEGRFSQWPLPNVWVGTTVENYSAIWRMDLLRHIPAARRFISAEPLLGPLGKLDLTGIDWVIVGGESGPGARPIKKEWVTEIRDQCLDNGTAFFFKQWGGVNKKKTGRELEGRTWNERPDPVQLTLKNF